jgi:transcriptional regulator with XRE-family HTH domain
MARAGLNWSAEELAREAGVHINTVRRFESGEDARMSSVDKLRRALEAAGAEFINGGGPGVRLRALQDVAAENSNASNKSEKGVAAKSITPGQCQAGRKLLGWSRRDLARELRVGVTVIASAERGSCIPHQAVAQAIQRVFEAAGIEFTNVGYSGVRRSAVAGREATDHDSGK